LPVNHWKRGEKEKTKFRLCAWFAGILFFVVMGFVMSVNNPMPVIFFGNGNPMNALKESAFSRIHPL